MSDAELMTTWLNALLLQFTDSHCSRKGEAERITILKLYVCGLCGGVPVNAQNNSLCGIIYCMAIHAKIQSVLA